MDDIILIDKPKGITSFGVISRMRRKLDIRKIGHAGTLDPLATGLMILGVGKGTKKLTEFIKLDKVYEVEVLLGIKTSTGDLEGDVIESQEVEWNDELDKKLEILLNDLVGEVELPVSIYSAIKKDGVALYKRARRGEDVEAPMRKMKIYWVEYLGMESDIFCHSREGGNLGSKAVIVDSRLRGNDRRCMIIKLRIKVGSGTYIRSIAEEIGKKLGYPATVKELRRTQVGKFLIEDVEEMSF